MTNTNELPPMWHAFGINLLAEKCYDLAMARSKEEALKEGRKRAKDFPDSEDIFVNAFDMLGDGPIEFEKWMRDMKIPIGERIHILEEWAASLRKVITEVNKERSKS